MILGGFFSDLLEQLIVKMIVANKKNNLLCINPGAAGRHGFHKKRTMIRFEIDGINVENMEVIELGNRSKLSNSI